MYVALREMLETKSNGVVKRIFPGDVVESFASWPVQNQVAALSTRQVREAPAGAEPLAHTLAGASTPKDIREAKERAFSAAVAEPKPALQPSVSVPSPAAPPAAVVKTGDFVCLKCDYSTHSARGLSIHMGREHKNP